MGRSPFYIYNVGKWTGRAGRYFLLCRRFLRLAELCRQEGVCGWWRERALSLAFAPCKKGALLWQMASRTESAAWRGVAVALSLLQIILQRGNENAWRREEIHLIRGCCAFCRRRRCHRRCDFIEITFWSAPLFSVTAFSRAHYLWPIKWNGKMLIMRARSFHLFPPAACVYRGGAGKQSISTPLENIGPRESNPVETSLAQEQASDHGPIYACNSASGKLIYWSNQSERANSGFFGTEYTCDGAFPGSLSSDKSLATDPAH